MEDERVKVYEVSVRYSGYYTTMVHAFDESEAAKRASEEAWLELPARCDFSVEAVREEDGS